MTSNISSKVYTRVVVTVVITVVVITATVIVVVADVIARVESIYFLPRHDAVHWVEDQSTRGQTLAQARASGVARLQRRPRPRRCFRARRALVACSSQHKLGKCARSLARALWSRVCGAQL